VSAYRVDAGEHEYFRDAVFNYPTLVETYKVAALDGLERNATTLARTLVWTGEDAPAWVARGQMLGVHVRILGGA
jgi:hypothetical protein